MVFVLICISIAVVIVSVFYVMDKKNKERQGSTVFVKRNPKVGVLQTIEVSNDEVIRLERLPAKAIPDESKLVEITDGEVLARINNLIPGMAQVGDAVRRTALGARKSREVLYRAVIPAGAKLADSRAMDGAVRGMYLGADGKIQGQANFVAASAGNGTAAAANAAAAAMGVASMVVGQYYMTQINSALSTISDDISQIQDFQNNEYLSRVFSVVAHVKKIADFSTEILGNDELRLTKISQLDSLEEECTRLLGQANLTIDGITKKPGNDYDAYVKKLGTAQAWYKYQNALRDVLYKISDLRYALHLGLVSREQCNTLLPTYVNQTIGAQSRLAAWHEKNAELLGVDIDMLRRRRSGLDEVVHFIPGLFDANLNYCEMDLETVRMITEQKSGYNDCSINDQSELYAEDVQLISKNGKVYYLPVSKES